jgi:DNA polymerase III alpha subunit
MITDEYGTVHYTLDELCDLLYQDKTVSLNSIKVADPEEYNSAIKQLFVPYPELGKYEKQDIPVSEFDKNNQNCWHMPDEYKSFDIAEWIVLQCKTECELQRVSKELIMFHDRNLFDLLRYMKYFVDTMRRNKIVWGVGRGSSVASYVLYLIGVHKIDSLKYELQIEDFLKD